MKINRLLAASALFLLTLTAQAGPDRDTFRTALDLYEKGMYAQARTLFESLGDQTEARGYAVLCAVRGKQDGYEDLMDNFLLGDPASGFASRLHYRKALNLFDAERYDEALREFSLVPSRDVPRAETAEYLFKDAYSSFATGDYDGALHGFSKVNALPYNDFTSPARYATGYINYEGRRFQEALGWFEQSVQDPRFEDISNYYIMECHFMMKDYKYVTKFGSEVYDKVPAERKPHLARLISEAYLVSGDAQTAKQYYDVIRDSPVKERGDYFYAGSLLYTTGDYAGAVENYSLMEDRTDSIGQVANYQLAYSLIQTKNKVAALEAFRDASAQTWDPEIQEDAYFNYAKLAFDLNNDSSVFGDYLDKYSDKAKGERIYSYMALAALYNHDYAGAVAAYDNIDELDADMQGNYVKANYLRANQLIRNGAWRDAVPCLKAVSYYSDKYSSLGQLSRYWLAESYFRDEKYAEARGAFNELHNISALDGRSEGTLIPYNIAYCYFQDGNYDMASRWFGEYVASDAALYRTDARTRLADCAFMRKDYQAAAKAYGELAGASATIDDIYPYYRAGLSYGLMNDQKAKAEVLSKVSGASPELPFYSDALYELGRSYVSLKQEDKAAQAYREIVKAGKDSTYMARALIGLGAISRNASRYDDALNYYKRVVEKMSSTGLGEDALLAIESIYQHQGEPDRYIAYLETLDNSPVKTDADKERLYFGSAEQVYLSGNWQKALVSLQNYRSQFPGSANGSKADFYIADCLRALGKKEQAADYYKKVIESGEGSFSEMAALQYSSISFSLERYADAYNGYKTLSEVARIAENQHVASVGMMESAYGAKDGRNAIKAADRVLLDESSTEAEKLRADYVKAKSYLATSDRKGAIQILGKLSRLTGTPEGAEACYLLIQDAYDRGDFDEVEKKVYAFSDSGSGQTYWLAKSFLLLGDVFVEKEDFRQARATFESVRDGYVASGDKDDVPDATALRLRKLEEMGK